MIKKAAAIGSLRYETARGLVSKKELGIRSPGRSRTNSPCSMLSGARLSFYEADLYSGTAIALLENPDLRFAQSSKDGRFVLRNGISAVHPHAVRLDVNFDAAAIPNRFYGPKRSGKDDCFPDPSRRSA